MERKAFRPKKWLGQHFLYDPAIAEKIIECADLSPRQTVIELGAGKGVVTKLLARKGVRVIALEVDADLFRDLKRYFETPETAMSPGNVEILNVDFTKISITGLLASRGLSSCVLVGNIPYQLTREVLFSFLVDEVEMLDSAYLMMQREVGERIVSPPGNRVYGITSVILQSLYSVRSLFRVSPGSFHPRPRVDSVVLGFEPLARPVVDPTDLIPYVRLVRNLFQQRRKTIHNTIRSFYGTSEAELKRVQAKSGIALNRRPETLDKEEFVQLLRAVTEVTSVE